MAGLKDSQQNIALSITLPQVSNAPDHTDDKNVSNQTRPPFFIAPCSSSDAHVLIKGAFCGGQGSAWAL